MPPSARGTPGDRTLAASRRTPALDLKASRRVGHGLQRPECVLVEPSGTLWVTDRRAAVCRISVSGDQQLLGRGYATPNGIALGPDGSIYVCDIELGTLSRLHPDGAAAQVLMRGLNAPNFVLFDDWFRLWITVSTRTSPREDALRDGRSDGYVGLINARSVRVVADGYSYTNELRIDSTRNVAYVAETGRGRLLRHTFTADGQFGPAEPLGPDPLYPGALPDGLALDQYGNVWLTELSRNAILFIRPDGSMSVLADDPDGNVLLAPSSIAFGGPGLTTAFIGSLEANHIVTFDVPWPGMPLSHWAI